MIFPLIFSGLFVFLHRYNKYIISIADNVVFGALDPTSSLTNLVEEQKLLGIEIHASV